jgi:hypothetical protein
VVAEIEEVFTMTEEEKFTTFCIGLFVGGVCTAGLSYEKSVSDAIDSMSIIFASAFGAGVAGFLGTKVSLESGYGPGLVVSFIWAYAANAIYNVNTSCCLLPVLGYGQFMAMISISLLGFVIYVVPILRKAIS